MAKEKRLVQLGASPELMLLLEAKHEIPRGRMPKLGQEDLDILRRLLSREINDRARDKAVAILALLDPKGACEELAKMLADREEDKGLRAVAAVALSHCQPRIRVQEVLLRALSQEKSRLLRAKITKALGRIGDPEALQALEEIQGEDHGVGRQSALSRTLIASRFGLAQDLPSVEPARGDLSPGEGVAPLAMEALDRSQIQEILQGFADSWHGIEVEPTVAYQLRIGKDSQALVFDRQALRGKSFAPIAERHLLLGALLLRGEEPGTYALDHLICSQPQGQGRARVCFFSPTGQPTYAGEARVRGESLEFSLAEAAETGLFPLRLTARLTAGKVEVEKGLVAARAKGIRMQPEPMPMPAVAGTGL